MSLNWVTCLSLNLFQWASTTLTHSLTHSLTKAIHCVIYGQLYIVESRYVKLGFLEFTYIFSNFDVSTFRVSRISFSIPNIEIHSNYVLCVKIINLIICILYRKSKLISKRFSWFLCTKLQRFDNENGYAFEYSKSKYHQWQL
jgi:hypothetical protein